jgi:hypothetical protein
MIRIREGHGVWAMLQASLFTALLGYALVLNGCGDDDENPAKPDPPGLPIYPSLDRPQRVLLALELAYESRDSAMYRALYDSSYVGASTDLNDAGTTVDFTYGDEVAHIRALASTPGISNVLLDLGPEVAWDRLSSDDVSHPDWSIILISGSAYTIQVTEGSETYEAKGETGTFQEFAFTPRLDSTSQTDTLWRIVRWREVGKSTPPGP